ncbi:MAG: ribosomal-processing cysteine protease Prp [Ruminococcus sp.]|uniref:ribosomal-processing cysteine protease Prp n=1 Tax=Ruminococcus sp. TaxID=41978 RepID=UPI0028733493|nr:ribosomal-processing cysteine protease Prp [Ruminococcus sp.]MBQ3285508.1 ribosomal-processing cysteine protease Prp [Ruminococcus sp.]
MITVTFFGTEPVFGFHITGHSDINPEGPEILCAAVSSAAYMTANTVTDVIGLDPELRVADGDMYLKVKTESEAEQCRVIFDGLKLHLSSVMEQYPKYLTISNSEV